MAEGIHKLIQAVYDESILKDMIRNGNETKVKENPLNDNFQKKEFQELWNLINHKYAYTCSFKSEELIAKSIAAIDEKLFVTELQYTTSVGSQKAEMNQYEVERGDSFQTAKTKTQTLAHRESSSVPYDLIGKIAEGTRLTRRTVAAILKGISQVRLNMFKRNPEEFISKTIRLVNDEKAELVAANISYHTTSGIYDKKIFTAEKSGQSFDKAFLAAKSIQDYVFTDGTAADSIEMRFAKALDAADEVCVYAKLPKGFAIPTPVGMYSPDWAIAFNKGTVRYIYFIAETKGSLLDDKYGHISPLERAKIQCAKALFRQINNGAVKYDVVDSYQSLLNLMIGQ